MKKRLILTVVAMLSIVLLFCLIFANSSEINDTLFTVDKNKISYEDTNSKINVYPAYELGSSGEQVIEVTNKLIGKEYDTVLVFTDNVKDIKVSKIVQVEKSFITPNEICVPELDVSLNATKDSTILKCIYDGIITRKENYTEYIPLTIKQSYSDCYSGLVCYFVSDTYSKDEKINYFVEYNAKINSGNGKWDILFKDKSETISEVFSNGKYSIIDPWFNTSFSKRRNITNTTSNQLAMLVNGSKGFYNKFIYVRGGYSNMSIYYNNATSAQVVETNSVASAYRYVPSGANNSRNKIYKLENSMWGFDETAFPAYDVARKDFLNVKRTSTANISLQTDQCLIGGCLNLSQKSGGFAIIENMTNGYNNDFTWIVFFRRTNTGCGGNCQSGLAVKRATGSNYPMNWNMYIGSGSKLHGDIAQNSGASGNFLTGTTLVTNSTWHMAALSYDKDGTIILMLDNSQEASASSNTGALDISSTVAGYIGYDPRDLLRFRGLIDEVRFYNRTALTRAQMSTIYNNTILSSNTHLLRVENQTNAPVVVTNAPAANAKFLYSTPINFSFSVSDADLDSINYTLLLVSTQLTSSGLLTTPRNFSYLYTPSSDCFICEWKLSLQDNDTPSSQVLTKRNLSIDVSPYRINITSLRNVTPAFNNQTIKFRVNASYGLTGRNSPTMLCNITIQNTLATYTMEYAETLKLFEKNVTLNYGHNNATSRCTQPTNGSITQSINYAFITKDKKAPIFGGFSNNTHINNATYTFHLTMIENLTLSSGNVTFNQTKYAILSPSLTSKVNLANNKVYGFNITGKDNESNENRTINYIFVEDSSTAILRNHSLPSSCTVNSVCTWTLNVTDNFENRSSLSSGFIRTEVNNGVIKANYTGTISSTSRKQNFSFTPSSAGTYTFTRVYSQDKAGNNNYTTLGISFSVSAGQQQQSGGGGGAPLPFLSTASGNFTVHPARIDLFIFIIPLLSSGEKDFIIEPNKLPSKCQVVGSIDELSCTLDSVSGLGTLHYKVLGNKFSNTLITKVLLEYNGEQLFLPVTIRVLNFNYYIPTRSLGFKGNDLFFHVGGDNMVDGLKIWWMLVLSPFVLFLLRRL